MADVTSLQIAINRFAGRAFVTDPIAVDGAIGPQTAVGTANALRDISANSDEEADTARGLYANLTQTGAINQDQIQASAKGLADFLNTAANEMGLPAGVAAPMRSTPSATAGGVSPLPVKAAGSSATTSISILWNTLPTWQKVAAGVVAGLAFLFVLQQTKHGATELRGYLAGPKRRRQGRCVC